MLMPICLDADGRLRAYCVTAQCDYRWFLEATAGAEANLEIQRAVMKGKKAYATLREDLKRGCILPPIVLSVSGIQLPPDLPPFSDTLTPEQSAGAIAALAPQLAEVAAARIYIIDGLQRTNALRQIDAELRDGEQAAFRARKLRIELWLNIPFGSIAYRMLLLNAGQRPMSMKHQIEILSAKLSEGLRDIQQLELFLTGEERRRARPGQFQLAKLAQAFQAWLQGQPNIDIRNVVMEELLAENALETLSRDLPDVEAAHPEGGFRRVVEWLVQADQALGPEKTSFLGNETVLQGFAAAVGACERKRVVGERVWPALGGLLQELRDNPARDPLAIEKFEALRKGFPTSKVNVGVATRELVFNGFQELFFSGGITVRDMGECWEVAAARVS